jgi:uncharacterized protein (TIGR02145 family)
LQIGNGTVLSGIFADIAWGDFPHFIKLEADFSGESNYVLLGTQELMSVPYALYAGKTDTSSLNLTNRFSTKLNGTDTISLSNRIDTKSSLSDTSLLNLTNRFNSKVNISDTSSMLNPYLRKSDSIIADLQNKDKLLQSFSNVIDIDGNKYKTVKIGSQVWMSENLKTSRYRNGDVIPVVTDNVAWSGLTTGARCWFDNDSTLYEYLYGNLYNWYAAADNRNICPTGWHVPSDAEFTELTNYLGGGSVAGGKMKSVGTAYWNSPNTGATNESGFSALPGGYIFITGSFHSYRESSFFWSATENHPYYSWYRFLFTSNSNIARANTAKSLGASIRCLKDPDTDINQSLNTKVNIADTSDMLNPYLRKSDAIVSVETDPVFNSSIAKGITGIDTAYWNRKINIADTSSMLTNYRNGLNQKVSNADTSSMLINYLRKSDALIIDLQNQLRLMQNHFKIQDIDGNTYNTITIGNQRWMAENLRVSRYRNGDIISLRTSNEWTYEEIGWRNWFNNDSATYEIPHGKLYNWYSANDNRGICPSGWHIPSKGEWQILSEFLGGIMIAGGKMKITGTSHWNYPNVGATNESGFSAYPSGARYGTQFQYFGTNAFFWSSTQAYSNGAWYLNIYSSGEGVEIHTMYMNQETSVRCLKDL